MNIEEGYVYVLYNPMYEKYGEIYKIGQAKNISDRLSSYSTYYPEQSEIKYSIKHPYYKDLEKIVHLNLDEYRMASNREFFKCNLELIKDTIDKVKDYTLKDISNILNKSYKDINNNIRCLEPINLKIDNIVKVYNESKDILKNEFNKLGMKLIVKIFIEKLCSDKEGKILIEYVKENKFRYKDLENNVINTSSGKLYSLLDNSINIKSFIYRVYLNTEDYIKLDKKFIDKKIIPSKFTYELLSYFN
jgi:hypothetical protein